MLHLISCLPFSPTLVNTITLTLLIVTVISRYGAQSCLLDGSRASGPWHHVSFCSISVDSRTCSFSELHLWETESLHSGVVKCCVC